MSYHVLPLKCRPKSFNELLGQDHIAQFFLNAIKNKRVPQAVIFSGPRGTGKTSTARILAKSLKCEKASPHPCDQCEDCRDISQSRHVDVMEIDGASHNGVEAIRDLRQKVIYTASRGFYRIYIIDEVHMLTISAFNALLKTLEEPPEHAIFVLATTEAYKIPFTISSRCQKFDFRRIQQNLMLQRMKEVCEKEKIKAEDKTLNLIAHQSEGSFRDCLSLMDQMTTFCEGKITEDKAVSFLGLTPRSLLFQSLEMICLQKKEDCLEMIAQLVHSGVDFQIYFKELVEKIRDLLVFKISNNKGNNVLNLTDTEKKQLNFLSDQISEQNLYLLFDIALKAEQNIKSSLEPQIVFEMEFLRLTQVFKNKD